MRPLVFATAFANNPQRYNDWISFYKENLPEVDLLLSYDGPSDHLVPTDIKTLEFLDSLGKLSAWVFPGWKRSFKNALDFAVKNGYSKIAHIESDCYLTPKGLDNFVANLNSPGYKTGYSPTYRFPETAIQVFNDLSVVDVYRGRYSNPIYFYENIDFEHMVEDNFHPTIFLKGDRFEDRPERVMSDFDYLAQCSLSDFRKFFPK
jgi:hypothetical protein